MLKILFCALLLQTALFAKGLVYDCFLFMNEIEILKIRLNEMDSEVDKFVLVESVETFRGKPKALIFADNMDQFSQFLDKIIHVVVEPYETSNPWDREAFQRSAIGRALENCADDDIVMVSDVDEIVSKKGVLAIKTALWNNEYRHVGVTHRYHSNFLNSIPGGDWRGTVATVNRYLRGSSTQGIRGSKDSVPSVANGWHFTWQGDLEAIITKIQSFSHAEMDTPEVIDEKTRGYAMRYLAPFIEIDDTFPQYVIDHKDELAEKGYINTHELQQAFLALLNNDH